MPQISDPAFASRSNWSTDTAHAVDRVSLPNVLKTSHFDPWFGGLNFIFSTNNFNKIKLFYQILSVLLKIYLHHQILGNISGSVGVVE